MFRNGFTDIEYFVGISIFVFEKLTFALFYLVDFWPTCIFFVFKSPIDSVTEPPVFLFRSIAKVRPYVTLNDAKRS